MSNSKNEPNSRNQTPNSMYKILLIEPFFTGSHKAWAEGLQKYSGHEIEILSLSGHHWKWRIHGAAITLANQFLSKNQSYDIILCSDMLNLPVFLSMVRHRLTHERIGLYFHENQITTPWNKTDPDLIAKRDQHYGFINYTSALAADFIWYNSQYHLDSFINALPQFLGQFPDFNNLDTIEVIRKKSSVMHLGLNLRELQAIRPIVKETSKEAILLWNHRWEFDKNPDFFFNTLIELHERGVRFQLIVLGQSFKNQPAIFQTAKEILAEHIIHWGFAESMEEYVRLVSSADILPVTSIQDFFGISVIEAVALDVFPLLPNRLAYPEHFPEIMRPTFIYEEETITDFANRLQRLIFDIKYPRGMEISKWVMQYDWSIQGKKYDAGFEKEFEHLSSRT